LTTSKEQIVLKELHEGVVGGHFATYITTKKIMYAGYLWPTLFKDTHNRKQIYYGSYRLCNQVGRSKGT
jgi:hypothetical protein